MREWTVLWIFFKTWILRLREASPWKPPSELVAKKHNGIDILTSRPLLLYWATSSVYLETIGDSKAQARGYILPSPRWLRRRGGIKVLSLVHSSLPNAQHSLKGILLPPFPWQFHTVKGDAKATVIIVINILWACYSPLKLLNMKWCILKAQHTPNWFCYKKVAGLFGFLSLLLSLWCINGGNIDLWA